MGTTFDRYIGIDYSGAKSPISSLRGLRVYEANSDGPPAEVMPKPSPRKYWTRRGVAEWLVEKLSDNRPTLVGIDHCFSFPLQYFQRHNLALHWPTFLDDFHHHWPTDEDRTWVRAVRAGDRGSGPARSGDTRWRRITEHRTGHAKSVFHFGVQGSVAHSSHAGIPWLRYLKREFGKKVHIWPFDGWDVPENSSVIAEVYPALWKKGFPVEDRKPDQHDAFSVCEWMRQKDARGTLKQFFSPSLSLQEQETASIEGWILGVM